MRVKLKRGKQKELICGEKEKQNLTWKEFSEILGVSKSALVEWKLERNLIPFEIYKKLDPRGKFNKYISKKMEDNWGQSKGGIKSRGTLKEINIPEKDEKLAEFIGILLGDGNINSFNKGKKIRTYAIRIAGNAKTDRAYFLDYVKPLMENLFRTPVKIYLREDRGVMYLLLHSYHLVKFLDKEGLKAGNKIKNQVTIPAWICKNNSFLRACLRGLIDTDGCIYTMKPKYPNYFQISFKNYNERLLEDVRKGFLKLGFRVSRISCKQIYITAQSEIEKYYKEIGFSNPKHKEKYLNIRKEHLYTHSPVV